MYRRRDNGRPRMRGPPPPGSHGDLVKQLRNTEQERKQVEATLRRAGLINKREAPSDAGIEDAGIFGGASEKKMRLGSAVAAFDTSSTGDAMPSTSINVPSVPRPAASDQPQDVKARNKRMFGLIQSTLGRFQNDMEKHSSSKVAQIRMQKEKKVESRLNEEEKNMLEEQQAKYDLLLDKEQTLRKKVEEGTAYRSMRFMLLTWRDHHEKLTNFIRTKTEPCIYFLPNEHNDTTRSLLESAKDVSSLSRFEKQEWDPVVPEDDLKPRKHEVEQAGPEAGEVPQEQEEELDEVQEDDQEKQHPATAAVDDDRGRYDGEDEDKDGDSKVSHEAKVVLE